MDTVSMRQAKAHLSRLVERVEAGEEVVIARAGRPVARLVPFRRQPGAWRGMVRMTPDFDATPAAFHDDDLVEASDGVTGALPLPPAWQKTFWGGPMPDFTAIVRQQRDEH